MTSKPGREGFESHTQLILYLMQFPGEELICGRFGWRWDKCRGLQSRVLVTQGPWHNILPNPEEFKAPFHAPPLRILD